MFLNYLSHGNFNLIVYKMYFSEDILVPVTQILPLMYHIEVV